MRAFTKAAALLLVHSVACESMPGPVRRVSATETIPTAYITLNVPVDGAKTQAVPLRLDLAEGDEPCSPAQVRINGQPLAQDTNGFGQGALTLDHDITITSNWTFACESLKQALTINVHSVNGNSAVDQTSFIARFYQTTPVQIATVENVADVRYLHLHTTVTQSLADSGEEHVDVANEDNAIYHDKYPVPGPVLGEGSEKLAAEPAPTPLGECRDVRCAFKDLAYRFRHSHEEVCESASGWRALFGCAPKEQPWMEDEEVYEEKYTGEYDEEMEWLDITDEDWESEEGFYANYEEDMLAMYYESVSCSRRPQRSCPLTETPKARKRMLMLVAETAVIVGAADARYFNEPKTLLSFDDKPTASSSGYPDNEKAILLAAENKAAKKTSVADEIAELRQAASVVSDLVSIEAAERRSSVDYDDEAPPAYELGNEREHAL
ncbi:hypothetical protein LLEC1_04341 [Akanthomyces lecanii]|uniref:Ubiquitin 3 binding protein But2 C-terminal domain-containing protein n=1 Tax=Cordyceps confragosa TaxID=2714763 RepID=A0A179I3D2_CORDF|nr:hypothetical protein LLEC1_04341 [Akanthomyces lecanii]